MDAACPSIRCRNCSSVGLYQARHTVEQTLTGSKFEQGLDMFMVATPDLFHLRRKMLLESRWVWKLGSKKAQYDIKASLCRWTSAICFNHPLTIQAFQ